MFSKRKKECNHLYVCVAYEYIETNGLTGAESETLLAANIPLPSFAVLYLLQCPKCGGIVKDKDFGFGTQYKFKFADYLNPPLDTRIRSLQNQL